MRTSTMVGSIQNGLRSRFGGALLSQQFEHGVDGKCVDVFHAKQFAFFCPIRLTK